MQILGSNMKGERAHSGSGRDLRVDRFDLIYGEQESTTQRTHDSGQSQRLANKHTLARQNILNAGQSAGACKSWPSSRSIRRFATASLSVRPRRPRRPRHTTAAWKLLGSYLEVGFAAPPRLLFLGSLASSAATSAGSHAPPPPASISSRHRSARRPPTPQTSARAPHARRGS